jgi:cytoskeleton protein RodZ
MADIGATLRETRIRDKIDITAVEEATKIRAKYLRALENEEWGVLPGPAYIKSFLRTYAEFLGLDAHMLVEEYRARFEQPEELELPAFAPNQRMRRRVRPPGPPSRAGLIAALAVALLGVLFVLGITGDDGGGDGSERSGAETNERARSNARRGDSRARRQRPAGRSGGRVVLSVVPARDVWVCLLDAGGRELIEGRTLVGGEREGPFRSTRFRITVGNGGGDFRVDGKLREVPDRPTPLGYAISSSGTRLLPEAERPTCASTESEAGSS